MRVKIVNSKKVYEGNPEEIWRVLRETSEFVQHQSPAEYFDGVIERLHDIKIYLEPPASARASDAAYAQWMFDEFIRLGRFAETDEPTTAEKEAEAARKKAEAAKLKAEEAKRKAEEAKAAKPAADKPDGAGPAKS